MSYFNQYAEQYQRDQTERTAYLLALADKRFNWRKARLLSWIASYWDERVVQTTEIEVGKHPDKDDCYLYAIRRPYGGMYIIGTVQKTDVAFV